MNQEHVNELTVGEVAKLFNLTVRTLHHWDAIGLVTPSLRDRNDYRLYSDADLERVHQVLIYRATGMELAAIHDLLDKNHTASDHLRSQRELLQQKVQRLNKMLEAVETLIEHMMTKENKLTAQEKAELFGDAWSAEYEAEAEKRWSETSDWKESQRRQSKMTKSDWEQSKQAMDLFNVELAAAFRDGVQPGSDQANELAEKHREDLNRWFDVSHAKQVMISWGYTDDPRFAAYYDKYESGLAQWLRQIIEANAKSNGVNIEAPEWR